MRDSSLELVHHFDRAVLHHIIHVAAQQNVGMQRILNRGEQAEVALLVQIAAAEGVLDGRDSQRR